MGTWKPMRVIMPQRAKERGYRAFVAPFLIIQAEYLYKKSK